MAYIDISNFIEWFISEFIRIGTQIINLIDNIIIYNGVSLLDLIIAIVVIALFLEIIISLPNNAMRRGERKIRKEKKNDK